MKIGFIGAGKMGLPVCKRLKASGHDLRVLARRPEQAKTLHDLGLATATSVQEAISGADLIFTCVSDDAALAEVVMQNRFQAAAFMDMSTVSPAVSEKIAAHLPKSVGYLRSPVSGSTALAEAGTLTALVSGPKAVFDEMAPVYGAFTKTAFHLGEAEEARYLKLAINSVICSMAALTGEALAFGRKGGLSHQAMMEVINQSAIASPLLNYKTAMIVSSDYKAAASLNTLKKDLDLFLDVARERGVAAPVNTVVKTLYDGASAKGLGAQDFFVLVQEAAKAST